MSESSTTPRALVLSDVFPPKPGGSGRYLFELFSRFPGLDLSVLAGPAQGDEAFDRASPLRIHRLGYPSSWGLLGMGAWGEYWRATREVRTALKAHRANAVFASKCLPEGLVAILGRRFQPVPLWCFAHGEELTLALTSRELRSLTRLVLARSSGLVANSEHTRQLLIRDWNMPAPKIMVVTPGVDTMRFVPAAPDQVMRDRLGWTGRRVILTIGALQKRKGQDMLIRALPAIRRQRPDVLYAIAGEGWELESLRGLAAEMGVADIVQFMGVQRDGDIVHAYQQCDLFALPNRQVGWDFEGFGIVLIEAQACGKPVVTGQSGGTSETIVPGETGEIVACERPEPLAEICATLLSRPDRLAEMGERGRAWAVERFDSNVLAAKAARAILPQLAVRNGSIQ